MQQSKFDIIPLEWDTCFFNVKSCRVLLNKDIDIDDIKKIKEEIKSYEFISIYNNGNNIGNNYIIGENTNAFLVDINIQFIKKIEDKEFNFPCLILNKAKYNQGIIDIAKIAYKNSKFTNDINLKMRNGELVYVKWIENSFGKEDKYFVICGDGTKCDGYILFSIHNKQAVIELIAVDEGVRGKNIGINMMQNLEKYLYELQIETLKVGTQVNNIGAVNFYHRCGFKEIDRTSVYHLWNK